ncbi:MAG: TlyA family RNA methyltransferase [Pseudomonadota bacterium]
MAKPGSGKIRADQLLVDQALAGSRSRAQALIMAGKVFTDHERIEKPGQQISATTCLRLRMPDHPWVSRGGIKLAAAFSLWPLEAKGSVIADLGASTGGFCDVLLHHGAKRVHAVDVGRGQLHERLRRDPRINIHERVNARYLDADCIPDQLDGLTCDVSFIGLDKILPMPMQLVRKGGWLVALVKPQFQLARQLVGKGGIVRDPALHAQACTNACKAVGSQDGWRVIAVAPCPIQGSNGNQEFLLYAQKDADLPSNTNPIL